MRDVAALAGVSAKTVSRVFNDDPHVLPETRARVEAALRQLSYVPNTVATTFRAGRAPVIGIAVPDLVDPFFGAIAKSVGDLAAENNMSILVTSLGDDPGREEEILTQLLRHSLSGLVLAPTSRDHGYLQAWADRFPIVFVDREPTGLRADSFTEDDHGGARVAVEHLVSHGHHRIAFIGDSLNLPTTINRLDGYRAALADHGVEVPEEYVALGAFDRPGAAEAVAALRALPDPPTALFSSNARCTMVLIPAVQGNGLALVGFGDFPMADLFSPPLTVIDQDPERVGLLAAARVLDRLAHPARRYRRRTVLPVSLIERESCH